jgi:hypothetical protein
VKWSSWNRSSQLSFLYDFLKFNLTNQIIQLSSRLSSRFIAHFFFLIDFLRHFFRTKFCFKDFHFSSLSLSLSLVKLEWPDEPDGGYRGTHIYIGCSTGDTAQWNCKTLMRYLHYIHLLDYYLVEGFFFFSSVASWKPFDIFPIVTDNKMFISFYILLLFFFIWLLSFNALVIRAMKTSNCVRKCIGHLASLASNIQPTYSILTSRQMVSHLVKEPDKRVTNWTDARLASRQFLTTTYD